MIDRIRHWLTVAAFVGLLVSFFVMAMGLAFGSDPVLLGGFLACLGCWLVALGVPYLRVRHASEELRSEDWDWPNKEAA